MISNETTKMSWGFQQTRPEVRGWTSYCRYLITENVWSNFIINSTSLSLSLDPTLSCYRHPLTATIVATGLLALPCYGVFNKIMQHRFWFTRTLISRTLFPKPIEHSLFRGPFPQLICTLFMKNQVWKIKLNEMYFLFIANLIFTASVACKIQVRNREKKSSTPNL